MVGTAYAQELRANYDHLKLHETSSASQMLNSLKDQVCTVVIEADVINQAVANGAVDLASPSAEVTWCVEGLETTTSISGVRC